MLSGRLALVTGGARGIGRAVCQVLANDGARVIVADLDRNGCEETMKVPSPKYTLQTPLCPCSLCAIVSNVNQVWGTKSAK